MRLKWHGSQMVTATNTRDEKPEGRTLAAELPASRFAIETSASVHRVYDLAPAEGEADMLKHLKTVTDSAVEDQKDRAAVNDAGLSMQARLAALNRLLARRWKNTPA